MVQRIKLKLILKRLEVCGLYLFNSRYGQVVMKFSVHKCRELLNEHMSYQEGP